MSRVGDAERNVMETLGQLELFAETPDGDQDNPTNTHTEYWLRKVERPSHEPLKKEIARLGYSGTGKKRD